jgi:hypothetical protein
MPHAHPDKSVSNRVTSNRIRTNRSYFARSSLRNKTSEQSPQMPSRTSGNPAEVAASRMTVRCALVKIAGTPIDVGNEHRAAIYDA